MKNLRLLGASLLCASLAACGNSPSPTQVATVGAVSTPGTVGVPSPSGPGHLVLGGPVKYTDLARDADGSILNMSQYDADAFCTGQGARLPTARELAQISVKLGSPRIRETAYPDVPSKDLAVEFEIKQMRNAGYSVFYKPNAVGQAAVDFYFQAAGYRMPGGNLGLNYFWSSSLKPMSHAQEPREAAAFSGETGSVAYYDRAENLFAVRCVIVR